MERKRTLLQRFEIPLNHLDFAYVKECHDAREMEKIVQILRSGEEGHYPDLTRCAEEKLRELKPDSKLFRYEEHIRGRDYLGASEWKPIYDWTNDIKSKDQELLKTKDSLDTLELELPPIRKVGTIKAHKEEEEAATTSTGSKAIVTARPPTTDYRKWDKYDADEEILRMDLAEERVQEEVERKNRLNLQKSTLPPKITELDENTEKERKRLELLTNVEREKLAEEYRLRGNEYFRAKEYENAVGEYARAIKLNPDSAAPAFNNRAIAYIKLQKFPEAIDDCEQCLQLQPDNLKARLRLAEATYAYGKRRESYDLYLKVLDLDAQNAVALKATTELRSQLGELPPPTATRIKIQEDKPTTSSTATCSKNTRPASRKPEKPKKAPVYDLAELVVPNRIVKNKLATAAEALSHIRVDAGEGKKTASQEERSATEKFVKTYTSEPELRIPMSTNKSSGKVLIEEL